MSVVAISPLRKSLRTGAPATRSAPRASLRGRAKRFGAHLEVDSAPSCRPSGHCTHLLEQREAGGEPVEVRAATDGSDLAGAERARHRERSEELVDDTCV